MGGVLCCSICKKRKRSSPNQQPSSTDDVEPGSSNKNLDAAAVVATESAIATTTTNGRYKATNNNSNTSLIIENRRVNVFKIKRQMKAMRMTLREISIVQCVSDHDRFESLDILFLREDLQVSDFPHLESVTIDFIKQPRNHQKNNSNSKKSHEGEKENNRGSEENHANDDAGQPRNSRSVSETDQTLELLDDKLYARALQTIAKDMRTHDLLRDCVDAEQLTISEAAFRDKRAFQYVMRKIKQLNQSLRKVSFKDIVTLKKNIFFTICTQMREISNLQEISVINTNIMTLQAQHLQHLLAWMQRQIRVFVISGANLIDEHIDILFFQKLHVSDLVALEKLELKNCPQLWKSDKFIALLKNYAQIKIAQQQQFEKLQQKQQQQQQQPLMFESQQQQQQQQQLQDNISQSQIGNVRSPPLRPIAISNGRNSLVRKPTDLNTSMNNIYSNHNNQGKKLKYQSKSKNKLFNTGQLSLASESAVGGNANAEYGVNSNDEEGNNPNEGASSVNNNNNNNNNNYTVIQLNQQQLDDEENEKYDNRHSRQLVLGNYLFEADRFSKSDFQGDIHYLQLLQANANAAAAAGLIAAGSNNGVGQSVAGNNSIHAAIAVAAAAGFSGSGIGLSGSIALAQNIAAPSTTSHNSGIRLTNGSGSGGSGIHTNNINNSGGANGAALTNGSNSGGLSGSTMNNNNNNNNMTAETAALTTSASENEFFGEFLKSSLRELTEIDMCQVVDFSGFSTLTMGIEVKRLICTFVTSSNTLSTLVIQYDRFIFKELCEQITAKCKTRHAQTVANHSYRSQQREKENRMRMNESMASITSEPRMADQQNAAATAANLGLNKSTRSNLMSLESLRVIASRLESLQSDSLCYMSFLSLFLISLEIDMQNQVVEDSIIFPTYYQMIIYLHKMAMLSREDDPLNPAAAGSSRDADDLQSSFAESMSVMTISSPLSNGATTANASDTATVLSDNTDQLLNNQNGGYASQQSMPSSPSVRLNAQQQQQQQSNNVQQVNSNGQPIAGNNQRNNRGNHRDQNSNNQLHPKNQSHAPAQQGSEIFEAIRQFQEVFGLDTTVQEISLRNFTWQNEMNTNKEKSFSNFLFAFFSLTCSSLTVLDFDFVNLSHTSLLRLQEILKKIVHFHHVAKLRKQQQAMDEALFYQSGTMTNLGAYFAGGAGGNSTTHNIHNHQQSILQMKREAKKSKYFLKRFRIRFREQRYYGSKHLMNIFTDIAKEVRIINACAKPDSTVFQSAFSAQVGSGGVNGAGGNLNIPVGSMTQLNNDNNNEDRIEKQPISSGFSKVLTSVHLVEYAKLSSADIIHINNHAEHLQHLTLVRCCLTLPQLAQIVSKLNRFRSLRKLIIVGNDLSIPLVAADADTAFNFIHTHKTAFSMRSNSLTKHLPPTTQHQTFKNLLQSKTMLRSANTPKQAQNHQQIIHSSPSNQNSIIFNVNQNGAAEANFSDAIGIANNHNNQNNNNNSNSNIIEQGSGDPQRDNPFVYCLNKIFAIKTLQHLDLSCNNLSAQQGETLLMELMNRSQTAIQYMSQQRAAQLIRMQQQQQLQQSNNNNEKLSPMKEDLSNLNPGQLTLTLHNAHNAGNTAHQTSPVLPNQNAPNVLSSSANNQRSGLYSKFIKNQITSNLRPGGQAKFGKQSKLRSFNTRFFSEEIRDDPSDNIAGPSSTGGFGNDANEDDPIDIIDEEEIDQDLPIYNLEDLAGGRQTNTLNLSVAGFPNPVGFAASSSTPKDTQIQSNLFLLSMASSDANNHNHLMGGTNHMSSTFNSPFHKKNNNNNININSSSGNNNYMPLSGRSTGRIKKSDFDMADLLEFNMQENRFEEEIIVELTKPIAILFPKIKVLDISAVKKEHPKKATAAQQQHQKQQQQQQHHRKNSQKQKNQSPAGMNHSKKQQSSSTNSKAKQQQPLLPESKEAQQALFGRLDNFITDSVELDDNAAGVNAGEEEEEYQNDDDDQQQQQSSEYSSEVSDQVEEIPVAPVVNVCKMRREAFSQLWVQAQQALPQIGRFNSICKLSMKNVSMGVQTSLGFWTSRGFESPQMQLEELDLSGCIDSEEVANLILSGFSKDQQQSQQQQQQQANTASSAAAAVAASLVTGGVTAAIGTTTTTTPNIPFPFSAWHQVRKLSLRHTNNLRGATWNKLISSLLLYLDKLEVLDLSDCSLNDERMGGIIDAILTLSKPVLLAELILSRNHKIGSSLRRFVFGLTQSNAVRLQTLDLTSCDLSDEACETMIQGILLGKKQRLAKATMTAAALRQKENDAAVIAKKKTKQATGIFAVSPVSGGGIMQESVWKRDLVLSSDKTRNAQDSSNNSNNNNNNNNTNIRGSFALVKLLLVDNPRVSIKMRFLTQYCFVFQLSDEENILFSMQFSSNLQQKKHLAKLMSELKSSKSSIYSHLFDRCQDEQTVAASTLSLGRHLFASRKAAEDVLLSSLRTFSSIGTLKLFINEKVLSIVSQVATAQASTLPQILPPLAKPINNLDASQLLKTNIERTAKSSKATFVSNYSSAQSAAQIVSMISMHHHQQRSNSKKYTFIPRPLNRTNEKGATYTVAQMQQQHHQQNHLNPNNPRQKRHQTNIRKQTYSQPKFKPMFKQQINNNNEESQQLDMNELKLFKQPNLQQQQQQLQQQLPFAQGSPPNPNKNDDESEKETTPANSSAIPSKKPKGLTNLPLQTIHSQEQNLAESVEMSPNNRFAAKTPSQESSVQIVGVGQHVARKSILMNNNHDKIPLATAAGSSVSKKKATMITNSVAVHQSQRRPTRSSRQTSVLSGDNYVPGSNAMFSSRDQRQHFSSFIGHPSSEDQQNQGNQSTQLRGLTLINQQAGQYQQQQQQQIALNSKYKGILIHMRKLESLVLESDEKLGVVSILEFFAQVGANLIRIDLSKVAISPAMFVRIAFRIPELFPLLTSLKFANIPLSKSQNALSQVAEALLNLLQFKSLTHLRLANCGLSPLLMEIMLAHSSTNPDTVDFSEMAIKDLDLSFNKQISFENVSSFCVIDRTKKLNLMNCDLVEERFCLNRASWKQATHLSSLVELNISYNKGLSVQFFRFLGEFLSEHKHIRMLDISHTAFYEAKQKALSYGLNKRDVSEIPLKTLRMRGLAFSKKEGSFELLKTVAALKRLIELDLSDMLVFSSSDVSALQTYLMFPNLARLAQIYKLIFHNCTFFFETSITQSEYAFSEHFHSSIYILTSCKYLSTIDLTGALRLKSHALHFLKQLNIIRKKQLLNYHLKTLILAQNCIPTSALRASIHNILFIFRNLIHLNVRSLLRYQSGYTAVLIEALDSYQTFHTAHVAQQQVNDASTTNHNQNSNNASGLSNATSATASSAASSAAAAAAAAAAAQASIIPLTLEEIHFSDISNDLGNNKETIDALLHATITNQSYLNLRYLLVHLEFACSGNIIRMQNTYTDALVEINEKINMKELSLSLNVSLRYAFKFSDANSIIQLKPEVVPIDEKKKTFGVTSLFHASGGGGGATSQIDNNIACSLPGDQITKSIPVRNSIAPPPRESIKPALKPTQAAFLFSRMRVEYVDCKLHEDIKKDIDERLRSSYKVGGIHVASGDLEEADEEDEEDYNSGSNNSKKKKNHRHGGANHKRRRSRDEVESEDSYEVDPAIFDHEKAERERKQKYLLVNEWNEDLFAQQAESEEQEIQLWRQFQPFAKKLASSKLGRGTHISLNYRSANIKLLSERYNIFVDRKYNLNEKITALLESLDALYLGNVLYHFLVSVCSFDPQNDLIDFLVHYLLFSAANNISAKNIRLPPFSILSEGDAQKISQAFVDLKNIKAEQKKIQNVLSIFSRTAVTKPPRVSAPVSIVAGASTQQQQNQQNSFTEMATIEGQQQTMRLRVASIDPPSSRISSRLQQITNRAKSERQALNATANNAQQEGTIVTAALKDDSNKRTQKSNAGNTTPNSNQTTPNNATTTTATTTTAASNATNEQGSKIMCNYFYKSRKGCNEYDEIAKLKKMPPSTLNIDNFSVNGLKAVYMICYSNDYFMKSDIDFESIMFVSTSLSFSLREYFYRKYASQKRFRFRAMFGRIMYSLMDLFVDLDNYFKYDESIDVLDKKIEHSTKTLFVLKSLVAVFLFACFVIQPTLSLLEIGPLDADGLSYISHFVFGFYVVISLFFEAFVVRKALALTQHLIPDIILTHQASLVARMRDFFFETLMNVELINYKAILFFQKTFFSILAQLDTYQDISFILIVLKQGDYVIAILAIAVILGSVIVDLNLSAKMLNKSAYSNLFFPSLNYLYEYATQAHLEGLTNLLDAISPHNVLRITENPVTRFLLPKKIIGLTINKSIFYKIKKVIMQDLPQIILQLLFTVRNLGDKQSTVVQMSIALNVISTLKSLLVILTIKQSVLNQMDFDELAEQKQQFLQGQFLQYQEKEIAMFEQISSNVRAIASANTEEQIPSSKRHKKLLRDTTFSKNENH